MVWLPDSTQPPPAKKAAQDPEPKRLTDEHIDFLAWALIPTIERAADKWLRDMAVDLPPGRTSPLAE